MSVDVTLTSYILNPWTNSGNNPIGYHGGTSNLIALSYANLDFTPSASDPYKSTSGDVFKVYVNGVRIYRQSDQDYAGGSGFLEDGDTSGQTLNGVSAAWTATNNTVWEINTALQLILLNVDSTTGVASTTLYGPSGLNVSFAESSSAPIIELRRAVQDLKTPAIDFSNASILTEQDLDNSAKNVFHVSQQAVISTENAMLFDSGTDTYKATQPGTSNPKRISNVDTPTSNNDAANKLYVDGGSSAQTVAGLSSEITLLGTPAMATATTGHIPVLAESNYKSKIETVADSTYKAKVEAVAGKETEVELLGTSAMATATTGHIPVLANVVEQTVNYTVTVANNNGNKFYIQGGEYGSATSNPALTLIRGYTYVFDTSDSSVNTHPLVFMNGGSTLGSTDGVTTDNASPGTTGAKVTVVVSDSVTITKYSCSSHGDGMGNTITLRHDDFKEVADVSSDITIVAGQIAPTNNLSTVAGLNSELTTVANSAYKTDIETVADSTYKAKVETVADSAYKAKVETVADSTYKGKVETVAGDTTAINSIHTNISQVTTFADTYHTAGTTEPSGSNVDEGDLWFDTANDVLKVYDGSSWASASSSIATVASQNEFTASNGQGTGNKYFAIVHDVGLELVFLNGVRLKRGSDYYSTANNTSETAIASGNAANFVRLETVPGSSDILSIMAFGQIANNLAVNTAGGTFTGGVTFEAGTTHNTGNNTFTMPTTRGSDNYVLTRDDTIGTGGTTWKETLLTPTISSISPTNIEETDTTQTIVITGVNFDGTASAVLIDNNGTTKTPTTSTRNSDTQITIVFSGSDVLAETVPQPLDVKVTQGGSSLSQTLENALTIDARPVWSSPSAGALTDQDYIEDKAITQVNFVATDAETTPTLSVTSGALPTGLTLSSAGALTGTPNVNDTYNSSGVQHNFTVTADDGTGNTTDRAFSITRKWLDGSTTALAGISCWHIRDRVGSSATLSDGLYYINPDTGPSGTFQVYCDMNTDGGGWTMLLDTNTGIPPHNSSADVFSGAVTSSYYSSTVRAPMHPTNDNIGSGASNSKCYARDWEDYHINNRGSANNGRRDYMVQQREGGSTFNSSGKDKFIVYDVIWLSANAGQTSLPGSGGNSSAFGYWYMDTSNGSAKWGDGTSYTAQNTYISMSSCFNDNSTCDEWHSTHVRDFATDGYVHINNASTSSPIWGHTFGVSTDPSNYNYAGWYDGSTQSNETGVGDRDKAISHWCRNNGTW